MGYEDETRVRRIQFHQSYSYEDFIQGYRPFGQGFERKNGIFYEFCKQAIRDESNYYVFIIDEINRGNLSKIFGELMVLIEPDKRDPKWAVPLTYAKNANEQFYIPKNVFLLGMMNTADRSLSMVDYALRRRFAFYNLNSQITTPSYREYLTNHGVPDNIATAIVDRIGALNQFISNKTESNLGSGFCVGHSFFMPDANFDSLDQDWYRRVIGTEIIPLLSEYWFDDDDRVDEWRGRLLAPM
jgi:5-methylcytosine-specific restriction protein B